MFYTMSPFTVLIEMVYCAVYGCKSSNKSREKIVFHRFPNNTAEAAKWLKFCRRADSVNLKNAAICGLHFKPSDYRHNLSHELNPGQAESRPKLKRGAVPSVALPDCNLEENDSRIRKKYLHGDSFAIQLQEEKRCKKCGSTFEDTSSDSPMVMQNVTLENRGCNKMLPPLNLDNFDSHLEKNIFDIFSEEPKTIADLADTVCLVCDAVIKDSRTVGVLDLYSEASVTSHTQQRVVVMLAVLINIPLHSDKAYSKSLCQQCYRHLDELDEIQHRAAVIKSNIENIYNQSVHKRHLFSSNDGDLETAMRDTVLNNGEGTAMEVQQIFSSSVSNNKVEAELPKVIKITHSTRTANPAPTEKNVSVGVPKPITIKVYKTSPQMNPTGRGLAFIKNKPVNQIKRKYRKRSEIVHLCKFCMKVFLTGEELKKHQKTHTTIECKFCGKILVRIGAWENHLKMFHNVEMQSNRDYVGERFSCDQCDKQFTSKSSIRYHMKLHEGKTYACEKCARVFSHPGTLRNHQLIHEEKKFICDKCGKGFRTNFHLIMHDNQTHRKARSWKCKYCEKAFARCATYREHVRSHCTRKASLTFLKSNILDKPDLGREDTQPNKNENGNLLFNEGCKMLSIEEVCADEEARIIVGEREVACEEQNFSSAQAELYAEEFVLSSDGNLIIDNLMGVK
ncbi:zinc finger protein 816-like isoform X2 [Macrobrachium nipponense]|uniref:zinc finger protein 816-like isoform X2 n=1 Tax=Macrobrachium nipponense TaxID=159736 RepID=UPI0030C815E6